MIDLPSNTTRFRDLADRLRSGYWFLPMLMAVGGMAGALVATAIDSTYFGQSLVWLTPNAALDTASFRNLAQLIATASLAFLGVLFSIMLVPLSIAATQLGPPVLRTFMRNTGTQLVLGLFIGNTVFALTLLAVVPEWTALPPSLSAALMFVLFLFSIAVLVYFIHEIARSLQASTVIGRLSDELQGDIGRELRHRPARGPDPAGAETQRATIMATGIPIPSRQEGYIRAIDFEGLLQLAEAYHTTLALRFEPGDFVMNRDALVYAAAATPVDEALADGVNRQFLLGEYRTITQDVEFGLLALVSVAVRALSPAINDPFTAIMCVQRLGAALALIAECDEPTHHFFDAQGMARVLGEPDHFHEYADLCFHQIRQYGRGSTEVLIALLVAIGRVAAHVDSEEHRMVLRLHADLIDHDARAGGLTEYDATRVRVQYDHTMAEMDRLSGETE